LRPGGTESNGLFAQPGNNLVSRDVLSVEDQSVGTASPPLLELKDLTTVFPTRRGLVRAVDGVNFQLRGVT